MGEGRLMRALVRASAKALRGSIMPRMTATVAVLVVFVAVSDAQTPSCSCPKGTPIYHNGGGDSRPLLWRYEAYRKTSATAQQKQVICYFKQVENRSSDEVRDIQWP